MTNNIISNGLSGLTNIGNTCYMNSALQCLSHTDMLCIYFLKKHFMVDLQHTTMNKIAMQLRKDKGLEDNVRVEISKHNIIQKMHESITFSLYKVFKALWAENCVVRPTSFKKQIGSELKRYSGNSQHCSYEFIEDLLNLIHEENKIKVSIKFNNIPKNVKEYIYQNNKLIQQLSTATCDQEKEYIRTEIKKYRSSKLIESIYLDSYTYWSQHVKDNYSIIKEHFTGMTCQLVKCMECNNITTSFESFGIMSLSLPKVQKITIFDAFNEELKSEILTNDSVYQCDNCNKKVTALKNVFLWSLPDVLILSLKRYHNGVVKLPIEVEFPYTDLSLNKYCFETRKTDKRYTLYSIIEHYGGIGSGHYIAYCKNPITNKWFKYDDSSVTYIPNIETNVDLKNHYILFYQIESDVRPNFGGISIDSE